MRLASSLFLTLCGALACAAPALAQSPASAGSQVPEFVGRLESGAPVPVSHRPFAGGENLRHLATGLAPQVVAPPYAEPDEFGISFEYDGMRADLERAGIRVQSQVGRLFTARVRRNEVGRLRLVSGLRSVRLARYLEPHLNLSSVDVRADLEHNATGTPPWYQGRAGKGLLLGDVDTGIDFTSPDFNDSLGKSRILYIWDQNDGGGPSPAAFAYGSEWTKTQIDNTPGTVRHRDTNGHGTAVAGVMIGSGAATGCAQAAYRFVGMAPQAQFIEVASNFSDIGIVDGVNYIFQKAAALGLDCVVNLSLGSNYGPHDGTDALSQAISGLTGPGRIVIASSGNAQANSLHGRLTTTSQTVGTDRFLFSVPAYTPAVGAFNDYVLVTGWYDPTASLTIRVKGPNATDTLSVGFTDAKDVNLAVSGGKAGKLFIANQNAFQGYGGTSTLRQFEIEVYDSLSGSAPRNGTWEIDVVSNSPGSIGRRVDIWIYASVNGAASLAAAVTGNLDLGTMVGEPADGDSVIAVGAHVTKASWPTCPSSTCAYSTPPALNAIAYFSCVGPRRDGMVKPELSAPGFGVGTTHSSFAGLIGACPADDGLHAVTQGTSFSAPHVSGAAALYLMSQPHAGPAKVRQAFEASARTDAFTGAVPNATWGYGKLDIYSLLDHVVPLCAVTSPVGGEVWAGNSPATITWTATDNVAVTTVNVDYSLHGAGGPWVNVVTGAPNTGSRPWTPGPQPSDSALVRVTALDGAGNSTPAQSAAFFHITTPLGVPVTGAPAAFWLAPPVPNPSNGSVGLRFSLARAGRATLTVYGVGGERIWSRDDSNLPAGEHFVTWNGLNAASRRAGPGLYFVRLTTNTGVLLTRLVRLD